MLNQQALHGEGLWEPSKDSRIYSRHFVYGEPTLVNPMNMGYDTTGRALLCSPPTGIRKCTEEKGWINLIRTEEATKDNIPDSETFDDELKMNETVDSDLFDFKKSLEKDITGNINKYNKQETEDTSTLKVVSDTFFQICFISLKCSKALFILEIIKF